MLIVPAIDILNGECVRLRQGSYASAQSYSQDPVQIARSFEEAGARLIHLVDLDAARGREQANRPIIRKIRQAVKVTLEVGGGIRRSGDIKTLLDMGINRLVLGTVLARNPDQAAQWCAEYGKVFMGSIDALAGQVRVSGWQEGSMLEDVALAQQAGEMGLVGLIYTNITRDGTLRGPDIVQTNRIAEVSGLPVILSGGISSAEDVAAVYREKHAKVAGVLIGKALYEKRIDLKTLVDSYQKKK